MWHNPVQWTAEWLLGALSFQIIREEGEGRKERGRGGRERKEDTSFPHEHKNNSIYVMLFARFYFKIFAIFHIKIVNLHFVYIKSLNPIYYFYLHVIDEKTKAQRNYIEVQDHTACKYQSWRSNLWVWASKLMSLNQCEILPLGLLGGEKSIPGKHLHLLI